MAMAAWRRRASGLDAFAGTWPGPTFSLWMPLADWTAWSRASVPAWNGQLEGDGEAAAAAMQPTAPASFSSYRSGGGHAVAQIAAPAERSS